VDKTRWTLSELGEEAGLPARTIRYYIARGLLAGPDVAGRAASYGPAHLERLREIKRLQAEGRMLAQIAQVSDDFELSEPVASWQYSLAEGVTATVRADLPPWRLRRIKQALARVAAELEERETDDDERV
jgi:DNA-binding transcriptional MerR regulator